MTSHSSVDPNSREKESGVLTEGCRSEGETADSANKKNQINPADPQVSTRRKRRSYSVNYKFKMIEAYENCSNALARGKLMRQEGLYYTRINAWHKERNEGKLGGAMRHSKKVDSHSKLSKLARENTRLKKKLSQAEAIIDLQKKVSELLGQHILLPEREEKN